MHALDPNHPVKSLVKPPSAYKWSGVRGIGSSLSMVCVYQIDWSLIMLAYFNDRVCIYETISTSHYFSAPSQSSSPLPSCSLQVPLRGSRWSCGFSSSPSAVSTSKDNLENVMHQRLMNFSRYAFKDCLICQCFITFQSWFTPSFLCSLQIALNKFCWYIILCRSVQTMFWHLCANLLSLTKTDPFSNFSIIINLITLWNAIGLEVIWSIERHWSTLLIKSVYLIEQLRACR